MADIRPSILLPEYRNREAKDENAELYRNFLGRRHAAESACMAEDLVRCARRNYETFRYLTYPFHTAIDIVVIKSRHPAVRKLHCIFGGTAEASAAVRKIETTRYQGTGYTRRRNDIWLNGDFTHQQPNNLS
jgi:hypothetical protein